MQFKTDVFHMFLYSVITLSLVSCSEPVILHSVTKEAFSEFVDATGYITDAENFGWSIVQKDVYNFITVDGATWKKPNGIDSAPGHFPVTQVSYNDALAYCSWANTSLPTYDEYWIFAKSDSRQVNIENNIILPVHSTNLVGNTWDITKSMNALGEVRLAGGSYLCSTYTCDGTNPKRKLYVSPDTGNSNISFSVIKQ